MLADMRHSGRVSSRASRPHRRARHLEATRATREQLPWASVVLSESEGRQVGKNAVYLLAQACARCRSICLIFLYIGRQQYVHARRYTFCTTWLRSNKGKAYAPGSPITSDLFSAKSTPRPGQPTRSIFSRSLHPAGGRSLRLRAPFRTHVPSIRGGSRTESRAFHARRKAVLMKGGSRWM